MRVLFTVFSATAHVHPIVPLAWALRSAGHEVLVAVPEPATDPAAIASITAAGLTAVPLRGAAAGATAADLERAARSSREGLTAFAGAWRFDPHEPAETGAWRAARSLLGDVFRFHYPDPAEDGEAAAELDELVGLARSWRPDLVLWDPVMFPAAIAARVSGAAHARLLWGLDSVGVIHRRTREELADPSSGLAQHPWLDWLGPVLGRYGLDFRDEMLLGRWTLDLNPARMRIPDGLVHVPVRRVPYNGAAPLSPWLRERPERPRVALSLGVSRRMIGGPVRFPLRAFFESVAELDLELVATLNEEQLAGAGPLPDNVTAVEYVPLTQLLPTCSAIVHHGAGGTMAAAVAHRLPQLVVPLTMWDEAVLARCVAQSGAGLVADPDALDGASLGKELARLVEDTSFRRGAQTLYEEMLATPAPKDVVPLLERLTAEHRTAPEGLPAV